MRFSRSIQKIISGSLTFLMLLNSFPVFAAALPSGGAEEKQKANSFVRDWPKEAKDLKEAVLSLDKLLGEIETSLDEGKDVSAELGNLKKELRRFQSADSQVKGMFARGRNELKDKNASV